MPREAENLADTPVPSAFPSPPGWPANNSNVATPAASSPDVMQPASAIVVNKSTMLALSAAMLLCAESSHNAKYNDDVAAFGWGYEVEVAFIDLLPLLFVIIEFRYCTANPWDWANGKP